MIPKIIHRTIPHSSSEVIDFCWKTVTEAHPSWEFMTHYDEDDYPYVGKYLDKCPSGAFRADLIRLDVIYRYGGIFLDSDIQILKPMDDLLNHSAFCSLEFGLSFGNIAFGAEPRHPAILKALQVAIELLPYLESGKTWKSNVRLGISQPWGPHVHTEAFLGRDDIVGLPFESFQPFHLSHVLSPEQKKLLPLWRTRTDVKSYPAPPLTEATYGVHISAWSWDGKNSWENRQA